MHQLPKKKILLLHGHEENLGGVVNFYQKLAGLSTTSKYEIVHFRVGRIQKNKLYNLSFIRMIDLFIRSFKFSYTIYRQKPAILHINPSLDIKSLTRDYFYVRLSRIIHSRIKVLTHLRGWRDPVAENFHKTKFINHVIKYLVTTSDHVIVLAAKFKRALSYFKPGVENISVIYTAVDGAYFNYHQNGRPKPSKEHINILFLSRIIKAKGIFEIAKGIQPIIDAHPDKSLKFIFAGDGEDNEKFQNYLEKIGVKKFTEFPGYVRGNEKLRILSSADIFIFPSYQEGCPNAVLEAMAVGLPIVSTNAGALEEIVEDQKNGLIVDMKATAPIVNAVNTLINDKQLMNRMAEANRKKAMAEFEVEIIYKKIQDIYRQILW